MSEEKLVSAREVSKWITEKFYTKLDLEKAVVSTVREEQKLLIKEIENRVIRYRNATDTFIENWNKIKKRVVGENEKVFRPNEKDFDKIRSAIRKANVPERVKKKGAVKLLKEMEEEK